MKYDVTCPRCKKRVTDKREYRFANDKERLTFYCNHCKQDFDILGEKAVMKLSNNVVRTIVLMWALLFVLAIEVEIFVDPKLVSITHWSGYGTTFLLMAFLSPKVVQFIHNRSCEQWDTEQVGRLATLFRRANFVEYIVVWVSLLSLAVLKHMGT